MHELSIASSILEASTAEAEQRGATRIVRIECRVGCLRQIDSTMMREAFDLAKNGTMASEATLVVHSVGIQLDCRGCRRRSELAGFAFQCPHCGSSEIQLSGGEELELTTMELEMPDGD